MPKTFNFTIQETIDPDATPSSVVMYQSDTINGTQTLLATSSLASLGYLGTGGDESLSWTIAATDGTKHYWLATKTAGGVESTQAYLAPMSALGTVTLTLLTTDVIGTVRSGLQFQADPFKGFARAGVNLLSSEAYDTTDVNGYAELVLFADSGKYSLMLDNRRIVMSFDTTGRSGETVNVADLI
jgi:hypothetical protein